jgi:hypothetical protein
MAAQLMIELARIFITPTGPFLTLSFLGLSYCVTRRKVEVDLMVGPQLAVPQPYHSTHGLQLQASTGNSMWTHPLFVA